MRYRAIPAYYDAEYAHVDMLQADVPFFLRHIRPRQSVLELAVGTARAAIPIAQSGHAVVGVDADPRMLALASRKRDSVGISARQLELIQCEILKLDLRRRFDWVCIFFNTLLVFTTTEEQDRALEVIRRHLRPRGQFWLDIFNPDLNLLARERTINLEPGLFYVSQLDRTVYRTTEIRPDLSRQIQRVIFQYLWHDARGFEHRQKVEFDLTWLFPRELRLLLERHGMRLEHIYGDHDGSPLRSHSPRIIARARLI